MEYALAWFVIFLFWLKISHTLFQIHLYGVDMYFNLSHAYSKNNSRHKEKQRFKWYLFSLWLTEVIVGIGLFVSLAVYITQ
jgi:hypothetical protein